MAVICEINLWAAVGKVYTILIAPDIKPYYMK